MLQLAPHATSKLKGLVAWRCAILSRFEASGVAKLWQKMCAKGLLPLQPMFF